MEMNSVNPKLLVLLMTVVAFAIYIKLSNPDKKYSTEEFWASATLDDVHSVPDRALLPGNKNGSVLMWAAMVTKNPMIISALVRRGADVNESDVIFSGTPLSAAAASSSTPLIIDELIKLGADINKVVGSNNKTPLIIAAELNPEREILLRLIFHGADIDYKDLTGKTALEQAEKFKNGNAVEVLEGIKKEAEFISSGRR